MKFKEIAFGVTQTFVISLMMVWIMFNAVFNLEVGMRSSDEGRVGKAQHRSLEKYDI